MRFHRIVLLQAAIVFLSGFFFQAFSAPATISSVTALSPLAWGTAGMAADSVTHPSESLALGTWDGSHPQWSGDKTIRFELDQDYILSGFDLWNNGGLGTWIADLNQWSGEGDGEGINLFTLSFLDASLSEITTFTDNASDYGYPPPAQLGNSQPESFLFAAVSNVRYVDLIIQSNHFQGLVDIGDPNGDAGVRDYAAFREVAFDGSPVPVPGAILLLGSGLIGLAGCKRKKG